MRLELAAYPSTIQFTYSPLLFVHGSFHGAWCWKEQFLPYFSAKGFPSYALSFRGHGESESMEQLQTCSLRDYVDDVLQAIQLIQNKPVLIGHSMGAAVVQKILHLHPDKIKAAVLMSPVPPNGMWKDVLRLPWGGGLYPTSVDQSIAAVSIKNAAPTPGGRGNKPPYQDRKLSFLLSNNHSEVGTTCDHNQSPIVPSTAAGYGIVFWCGRQPWSPDPGGTRTRPF
ncbi:alpha/beta hydrolase [Brevibacillus humidisoli]|uniref:alpha/beta hydrolase n=1 Tax=Brevibacillus humidisoli TaxID=2895522 RepID=UPI001E3D3050|nr:alpha/beta fold hydrolase [Brevibacillus humidisoli]UFJ41783.1 alpha/beta hydrolase [Brevibacillus humidisoli]